MKKIIFSVMLLVVAISMASCGSETIQIAWFADGNETAVMNELLDQYAEETGVQFELVEIAYDNYEQKLSTMVNGGNAPALARVTEGNLNNFQTKILSLDGVYSDDTFKNKFYNTAGELISLPMDVTANGLFVNLDLLDANSVDYPTGDDEVWTWTEFHTEMMKLDGATGVAAPGLIDNKAHRLMPLFVYQTGNVIWENAYTESNLTDAAVVSQLETIMQWYEDGFFDQQAYVTTDSTASMFRSGQYGFHFSGNWNVSGYSDLTFNWTVLPMPTGENGERGTILGGKSLAAFKDSGYEEEAKAFIEWFAEAEQHDYYTENVPFLSPRVGAQADYGDVAAEYAVFLEEIANTSDAAASDWLAQVMIPGMYGIINPFAEEVALNPNDRTALQILTDLETALKAAMTE